MEWCFCRRAFADVRCDPSYCLRFDIASSIPTGSHFAAEAYRVFRNTVSRSIRRSSPINGSIFHSRYVSPCFRRACNWNRSREQRTAVPVGKSSDRHMSWLARPVFIIAKPLSNYPANIRYRGRPLIYAIEPASRRQERVRVLLSVT